MGNYFSSNLKYIREKKGLSQNKLAQKIGVNQTTIARWEDDNRVPTIDNAVDISEALNIPLPELLGIDLRLQEKPKKTIFNKDGIEITVAHNGELDDKMLLEINNLLLEEKILQEELKKNGKQNEKK